MGHVGIILCFEASRLSRNSKDWAQLFELCGHLDTLVADLDQVYDLSLPDDRLILGVNERSHNLAEGAGDLHGPG